MNRKQIRKLTPEGAWELLLTDATVEYFVSEFIAEGYAKKDITAMARRFAKDTPSALSQPMLQEDIDYIAELIEKNIRDYLDKKGGIDKLNLYTIEELDKMWDENVTNLFSIMADKGYKIKNERIRKMVEEKHEQKKSNKSYSWC